jgi:serine/threonine protein kinase
MGAVYRARDLVLEETVALKVLRPSALADPELRDRFRSEIKLARRVTHPAVCRIHDFGEDGGLPFISMELVEGESLQQVVRRGPVGRLEAFDLAIQVAEGLAAIHAEGILHRDLKTANLVVDAKGRARILDFGIAKNLDAGAGGLTASGRLIGTPEYMSPEQALGATLDARSDVYSLGVVFFELLTGRVPFRAARPAATLLKLIHEPPPLDGSGAPDLPASALPILRAALAKDPTARPASALDLAEALRVGRASLGLTGRASTLTHTMALPLATTRRLKPWLAWALGAAGVVALLTLVLMPRPRASPRPEYSPPERSAVSPSPEARAGLAPSLTPASRSPARPRNGPGRSPPSPPPVLPTESGRPELAAPRPVPVHATLPVGTALIVRITSVLRSDRNRTGEPFAALLDEGVTLAGRELLAREAPVSGRLEGVGRLGPQPGRPYLDLSLTSVRIDGRDVPLRTAYYRAVAPSSVPSRNLGALVIGALAGAGLGAALGGEEGAATGAVVGSGAAAALTDRQPSRGFVLGNRLTFRLAEPLVLEPGPPGMEEWP